VWELCALNVVLRNQGITAYRFRIPASVYENVTTNPANAAFRAFTSPNGLFNVTTCEYKARVRVCEGKGYGLRCRKTLTTRAVGAGVPVKASLSGW
jgi:hypothetical protein